MACRRFHNTTSNSPCVNDDTACLPKNKKEHVVAGMEGHLPLITEGHLLLGDYLMGSTSTIIVVESLSHLHTIIQYGFICRIQIFSCFRMLMKQLWNKIQWHGGQPSSAAISRSIPHSVCHLCGRQGLVWCSEDDRHIKWLGPSTKHHVLAGNGAGNVLYLSIFHMEIKLQ